MEREVLPSRDVPTEDLLGKLVSLFLGELKVTSHGKEHGSLLRGKRGTVRVLIGGNERPVLPVDVDDNL